MNLPPLLHCTTLVEATIDGLQPRMRTLISYVVEIGSIHLEAICIASLVYKQKQDWDSNKA